MISKFLLAGDKFMPEMNLRQAGFTYIAWGPFTKKKGRTQKPKETGDSKYIYQNEIDEACFQHDMAYKDFKVKGFLELELPNKYYMIKHFILLNIQNIMDINADLLQWFINFSIKSLLVVILKVKLC